ncbi:MAG: hypothetical protein F4X48_02710 [Acidimicrobiia bacterium]|nr:hypothetical protein [Acidimicrobiia bacterium]MYC57489.1 hypothetical protein [Acidimicrobiia bacterium]MYI30023.1 hypothetical protein [Acidimicrobiia bacterium]
MLALPEVETIRRDLDRELSSLRIKSVELLEIGLAKRSGGKKKFVGRLEKAKITGVRRRGLYLMMGLDTGEVLVIHLGAGGQLRRHANRDEIEPNTVVSLTFTKKGQLRLLDQAGDVECIVVRADKLTQTIPELEIMGIDPLDQPVPWRMFGQIVLAQEAKLKAVLTDDRVIVGLGELYSDEILFAAGLRYDRTPNSLGPQELRRLHRAMVEILHDAVKHRGCTLEGSYYVDVHGVPGGYAEYINVFKQSGRNGRPCPRCHRAIQKYRYRRRWTYYCEQCQI